MDPVRKHELFGALWNEFFERVYELGPSSDRRMFENKLADLHKGLRELMVAIELAGNSAQGFNWPALLECYRGAFPTDDASPFGRTPTVPEPIPVDLD